MGMDISFNKTIAALNGLQTVTMRRAEFDSDIDDAVNEGRYDYAAWLREDVTYIRVPGEGHLVEAFVTNPYKGVGNKLVRTDVEEYVIRANTWGSTYGPMTEWLKSHHMTWSEF